MVSVYFIHRERGKGVKYTTDIISDTCKELRLKSKSFKLKTLDVLSFFFFFFHIFLFLFFILNILKILKVIHELIPEINYLVLREEFSGGM